MRSGSGRCRSWSSKPVRSGNPRLGRFDSCAAPLSQKLGSHESASGPPPRTLARNFRPKQEGRPEEWGPGRRDAGSSSEGFLCPLRGPLSGRRRQEPIILLLWLNYSAVALLFGAELNAELEREAT